MIIIESTKDLKLVHSIVTTPGLFELCYGQSNLKPEECIIDVTKDYYLFKQDEEIIGVAEIREITKICVEAHIRLLPKYWGTGLSIEVNSAGHEWAVEQGYRTMITNVPANCPHVLKYMVSINYKPCGLIKNGIIWHGHLVSLILFEYDLTGV